MPYATVNCGICDSSDTHPCLHPSHPLSPPGHGYVEVHIPGGMPPTGRLVAGFGVGGLGGGGGGGGGGDNDDAGSVASSSQASGSEALDVGTAASGADGEDELVADWRRAKR